MLLGCLGIFWVFAGVLTAMDTSVLGDSQGEKAPPGVGYVIAIFGGAIVFLSWMLGFLTILSGRYIAQRIRRKFSMAMALVNCAIFPIGTALGVFDLVALTNEQVKNQYGHGPEFARQ
jgi:hypothetical protein